MEIIWNSANYTTKIENKLSTKALLSYFLKKLSRKKKYLKDFISNTTLLKAI